jgi:tetratricopeptide (TPR) repeat protein
MMVKFESSLYKLLIVTFVFTICCVSKENKSGQTVAEEKKRIDTTGLALSANIYYKTNMYSKAVDEYSVLIKYDSLNGENYYRRGYSLSQLNKQEQAVPDFIKSAELGYKPCDAYHSLALIYFIIFQNDSLALEYCKKCLEIDPNSKDVRTLVTRLKHKNGSV